ncbi:MAG: class B sortase [Oscillospiraceae bacterium]|nr:class B sortase [Oscillospiraceae bacterium]
MNSKKRKRKIKMKPENTDFLNSVESMTENDITLNETAKKAKKQPVDVLRYFVLLVCITVFIYSGYNIVEKVISYVQAANDNNALRNIFYGGDAGLQDSQALQKTMENNPINDILYLQNQNNADANVSAQVASGASQIDQMKINLKKLTDINSDTYGWIKVNGTNVDYVVVQGPDNDYYLRHNFYKITQYSASIFADFRNDKDVSKNQNTIIYGHNMADATMFSTLMNYWNKEDVFDSGIIELRTLTATYKYEVFSVHQEKPTYPYFEVSFGDGCAYASFLDFVNDMKSRSHFQKDVKIDENSKLITLSTCTNWRDMRLVVQGVLVEIDK